MKQDFNDVINLKYTINTYINDDNDNNILFINSFTYDIITTIKLIKPKEDEIAISINNIISDNSKYGHLSIRKIIEIFNNSGKENGKKLFRKL